MLAACLMTSCFQNEVTLRVNKDGSGTLTEETVFGPKAVEMLAQLSQMGGAKDPFGEMISETKAKARASEFGEGVMLEKTEAIVRGDSKGGRVVYRFADINKLKFTADTFVKNAMPVIPGAPPAPVVETAPVTFTFAGGKLTMIVPEPPKADAPAMELPANDPSADPAAQQAMKELAAGAKLGFKIIIEPGIAETNATYVDGNAITLSDLEVDKMLEDPATMKKLSQTGPSNPAAAFEILKNVEGVKVESKREITVTLK